MSQKRGRRMYLFKVLFHFYGDKPNSSRQYVEAATSTSARHKLMRQFPGGKIDLIEAPKLRPLSKV